MPLGFKKVLHKKQLNNTFIQRNKRKDVLETNMFTQDTISQQLLLLSHGKMPYVDRQTPCMNFSHRCHCTLPVVHNYPCKLARTRKQTFNTISNHQAHLNKTAEC